MIINESNISHILRIIIANTENFKKQESLPTPARKCKRKRPGEREASTPTD